jgi:Tfp pilus assembly protein PilN
LRPVNLIPPDQRRARREAGVARKDVAVYGALGVLALAVLAVTAVVLTSNKINDRKASIAQLEREAASAKAAADALRPYGTFAQAQEARVETVNSLVTTSFNWERVMRTLARAIPSDAWLVSFKGTVRPDVQVQSGGEGGAGGGASGLRSKSQAPAIELTGCTYSHSAVARMMTRMRNLDDVTEVVLKKSERPEGTDEAGAGAETGPGGDGSAGEECRTRYRITKFEILVVFGHARTGGLPSPPSAAPSPTARAQSAAATASAQSSTPAGATPGGGTP